ncbi:hypothetical protein L1987_60588 [Smallanthus sonchifolius]|uniref:Uncharacterized protein n=1 Tax=Smallanthus sonchifolius TaxID=185202 RepID=A0ACB9D8L6_9ASTR|nr:hypothetical protein L1987_60588 [Smallanthus sonchifolius]
MVTINSSCDLIFFCTLGVCGFIGVADPRFFFTGNLGNKLQYYFLIRIEVGINSHHASDLVVKRFSYKMFFSAEVMGSNPDERNFASTIHRTRSDKKEEASINMLS